ncbi:class II aldolase/adducin family protein [candidate division WOR-3 bacterium]|nr:class II aldolase/adducin family protein [candidate division WOR-3 bacterium]
MDRQTLTFNFNGQASAELDGLVQRLRTVFEANGYCYVKNTNTPRVALNFLSNDGVKAYRRNIPETFVLSLMEVSKAPSNPIEEWYPYLVRTLSNMLLVYIPGKRAHFFTLDLGYFVEDFSEGFYDRLFERIHPMASSVLVVKNRFEPDLEPELWNGDELSGMLSEAGKKLGEWDLLPAAFPIDKILPPKDFRHVQRLYGIGGLSYGNLSVRKDEQRFWMSASGVDKSKLRVVGRDILMVKGYDRRENAIVLSVPTIVEPRRVSVDAIEHWLIYQEHPEVKAIIHVHAWMEGVPTTLFQYPCGTYQLGQAVAEKVRDAADPAETIVGLKNHGLTVTGRSLSHILERIDGKLLKHVPME